MNASFFSYVQDAPWYTQFLSATLQALDPLPDGAKVLDMGVGPGKLIELGLARPRLQWAGADVDAAMLEEARKRPPLHNVSLYQLAPNDRLPFADATFDAITFCSVLYLLPDPIPLLQEAWRVLRPDGRLVALTPTGNSSITPAIIQQIGGWGLRNLTIFLWHQMTAANSRSWAQREMLPEFARQQMVAYVNRPVLHGLAIVEVISSGVYDNIIEGFTTG